jgi:hypothetical protein
MRLDYDKIKSHIGIRCALIPILKDRATLYRLKKVRSTKSVQRLGDISQG